MKAWIHHLALNGAGADGYPKFSLFAGLDATGKGEPRWIAWEYNPVEGWEEILGKLMAFFWKGLMAPLHFFPGSSWAYARDFLEKGRSHEEALQRAQKVWIGNRFSRGEGMDNYFQRCFGNIDPLDSAFAAAAKEVFGPLLGHQEKVG